MIIELSANALHPEHAGPENKQHLPCKTVSLPLKQTDCCSEKERHSSSWQKQPGSCGIRWQHQFNFRFVLHEESDAIFQIVDLIK